MTEPADAASLTELFQRVFDSYPVPAFDPGYLREQMEGEMIRRGFPTACTFAGTLTNSVNIASKELESMNVWHKKPKETVGSYGSQRKFPAQAEKERQSTR